MRVQMRKSVVSIVKGQKGPDAKEIDALVRNAIALVGGIADIVSPGDTAIINPNLIAPASPDRGATTDYRICRSIANLVKEIGANPIIAESSAIGVDTEESFTASGYNELRNQGFEVIDLKKSKTVKVPVPKGRVLKELELPEVVVKAQAIISVPVMKTHDQVLATLSLKNMKGVLPDALKKKFHTTYGVFQAVADLNTVVRPALAVVDGIIGQEGLGPLFGTPIEMDLIIAGKDPVAVDAITGLVMGIEPEQIETTKYAAELGIGVMDPELIEVVGEQISKVKRRFKLASEAISETIRFPEGFDLIFNEKACTGCRNGVLSVLRDLSVEGQIDQTRDLRIIAGQMDEAPLLGKRTLLVGACTARFKGHGIFVKGCPPNNVDIISAITEETGHDFFSQLPQQDEPLK